LFAHVTRACQGVVFHSIAIAKKFMEKAKTNKGLKVTVDILTGVYETRKNVPPIFLKTRTYLWTNIFHYGITKPWEQNDRIGKLFLTES
jgi:hypothetical protein